MSIEVNAAKSPTVAPIAEWEWFAPHGAWGWHPYERTSEVWRVFLDGVEYLTDKMLILRRDLLPDREPDAVDFFTPKSGTEIPTACEETFTKDTEATWSPLLLHPYFAEAFQDKGIRVEQRGRLWDLYLGTERVGALAAHRGGIRPDGVTPDLRAAKTLLDGYTESDYLAWQAALLVERHFAEKANQ